jgi:two-component system response regulator
MSNEVEILLVDDCPEDVELTIRALRRNKIANEIAVAEDGPEALDFLFCRGSYQHRSPASPPKLVLLDLKLPKIGGLEVLREMRGDPKTRTIPVVILTSSKEQKDLITGYDLGVNAFVQKPVDFVQFGEAIRQIGMFWMLINQAPARAPAAEAGLPEKLPASKAQGA